MRAKKFARMSFTADNYKNNDLEKINSFNYKSNCTGNDSDESST